MVWVHTWSTKSLQRSVVISEVLLSILGLCDSSGMIVVLAPFMSVGIFDQLIV